MAWSFLPVLPKGGRAWRLWFALPAIALVGVFFALPFLANGALSFARWTGFSSSIKYAGLDNFRA